MTTKTDESCWERLEAFARLELGLRAEEVAEMTPRQLGQFLKVWKERQRRESMRAAMICAAIYNANLRPKTPYQPAQFLNERKRVMSAEEQIQYLKSRFS